MKTINFHHETGNYLLKVTGVSKIKKVALRGDVLNSKPLKIDESSVDVSGYILLRGIICRDQTNKCL